ncbi:uncharacterized protein [Battus philenor]|uniref:uncharacterized protein n=1 Tax=Battus philenor TaxID=42288 RepID=UPI0035CEE9A8
MSTQSKKMPLMDVKFYVRLVATVFSVSAATSLVFALLRLLMPQEFYKKPLVGTNVVIHYLITGIMVGTSAIGLVNSGIMIKRGASDNRSITTWLLLDSLFETSRVVYIFVSEIVLNGMGTLQIYELLASAVQYLLDSFFYCQMILRH